MNCLQKLILKTTFLSVKRELCCCIQWDHLRFSPVRCSRWSQNEWKHQCCFMGDICVSKYALRSLTQTQFTVPFVDMETFTVVTSAEFIIAVVCSRVLQIMYDTTQPAQRGTAAALKALPLISLFKMVTSRLWMNKWNVHADVSTCQSNVITCHTCISVTQDLDLRFCRLIPVHLAAKMWRLSVTMTTASPVQESDH